MRGGQTEHLASRTDYCYPPTQPNYFSVWQIMLENYPSNPVGNVPQCTERFLYDFVTPKNYLNPTGPQDYFCSTVLRFSLLDNKLPAYGFSKPR